MDTHCSVVRLPRQGRRTHPISTGWNMLVERCPKPQKRRKAAVEWVLYWGQRDTPRAALHPDLLRWS